MSLSKNLIHLTLVFLMLSILPSFGSAQQPEDLKLVPGNALAVVHIDIAKLWHAESMKDMQDLLKKAGPEAFKALEKRFVPDPFTVKTATGFIMFPNMPGGPPEFVFLISLSKPISEKALFESAMPDGQTSKKDGINIQVKDDIGLALLNQGNLIAVGAPSLIVQLGKDKVPAKGNFEKFLKGGSESLINAAINFNVVPKEALAFAPPPFNTLVKGINYMEVDIMAEKGLKIATSITYEMAEDAKGALETIRSFAKLGISQLAEPRLELEKRLFPKGQQGVTPLTELPEFMGALVGLAMLNEVEGLLKNPPIKLQGASLLAEYSPPSISTNSMVPTMGILVGLLLPAVQKVREAATRANSMNNLKQICLAFHNYHDTYNGFPAAAITDKKTGNPLLSWRVAILPYIEEQNLYQQFKLDEPWDSEHNLKLAKNMPKVYFHPKVNKPGDDKTHYKVFTGKDAVIDLTKQGKLSSILDGTSNTIMVVEAADGVVWTKPEDIAFDPKKPLPKMLEVGGGFNAGFADGSVRFLKSTIDPEILKLLIQKNDGKVIPAIP